MYFLSLKSNILKTESCGNNVPSCFGFWVQGCITQPDLEHEVFLLPSPGLEDIDMHHYTRMHLSALMPPHTSAFWQLNAFLRKTVRSGGELRAPQGSVVSKEVVLSCPRNSCRCLKIFMSGFFLKLFWRFSRCVCACLCLVPKEVRRDCQIPRELELRMTVNTTWSWIEPWFSVRSKRALSHWVIITLAPINDSLMLKEHVLPFE